MTNPSPSSHGLAQLYGSLRNQCGDVATTTHRRISSFLRAPFDCFYFLLFATNNVFTICKLQLGKQKAVTREPKRNHGACINWDSSAKI